MGMALMEPPSWPDAWPVTTTSPHVAEKVPATAVDVWLVTFHWKFVHEDGFGRLSDWADRFDCDAHMPTRAVDDAVPVPGFGVVADVGAKTLPALEWSKAHAAAPSERLRRAAKRVGILGMVALH
jgi:hypothetical protein